jgi:hypothetical protein
LDTVKISIIDNLYNHNIDSESLPLHELLIKRLQLSWQLEQWRQNTASFCDILSEIDLCQQSRVPNVTNRLQVLLSIQYYSVTLLINGPVLTKFLSEGVNKKHSPRDKTMLIDSIMPVIKSEIKTARELLIIIDGATACGESFFDCNAAWWNCNYISEWLVRDCRERLCTEWALTLASVHCELTLIWYPSCTQVPWRDINCCGRY